MDFEEWEPYYEEIISDFGFSREQDEASARLLEKMVLIERLMDAYELGWLIGKYVTVFGNGPSLEKAIRDDSFEGTLISAGPSTSVLMKNGVRPDILVTDLDGPVDTEIEASSKGTVAIIHAHGDNMHLIDRHAGRFTGKVIITTQSRPFGQLVNVGGFTDGDRAVMLARAFGAKRVTLIGFDFDHPIVKIGSDREVKMRKLAWAKRLIFELNPKDVEIEMV